MVPQWLNPKTYLNVDIRVATADYLIAKNVDPFNQHVCPSGVDLYFNRTWNRDETDCEIHIKASINDEPFDALDKTSEFTLIRLTSLQTTEAKELFQFLLVQGRKQEDQYRKNCHIRILKVLDGPDSEAAKHEIQQTPRELS